MPTRPEAVRGVELWMLSNVATGAATASFLNLLLPPFVTAVTGSAARVGVVFAVISLSAVVGPLVGRLADRTGRHRLLYLLALAVMAASFALLAVDVATARWSPVFGVLMGASYATQGTIGPAFIVGAGLPARMVAKQLTVFNLAYPVGQLLGAVVVAASGAAGFGSAATFWVACGTLVVLTLVTAPALGPPARRLSASMAVSPGVPGAASDVPGRAGEHGGRPDRRVISSAFVIFLLVVVVSSLGSNGLQSQLANVMPAVYGFSGTATALLVATSGLLNIGVLVGAGAWMTRSGPLTVYTAGTIIRTGGALLMVGAGLVTTPVLIFAGLAMIITYQGIPIPRLAAADLAVHLSTTSATQANGLYFAASALGAVGGSLVAGHLAGTSYLDVVWLAAGAGVVATVLTLSLLVPAARRNASRRPAHRAA